MKRRTVGAEWVRKIHLLGVLGASVALATAAAPSGKVKISGTVRASMGKPVKGVAVRATHLERGTSVTVFTSGGGSYRIEDLEPGHYEVRLSKRGYVTTARRLSPGGPMPLDFGLLQRPRTAEPAEPTALAGQFPTDPDKSLLVDFCLRCHSVIDLASLRKDRQEWDDVVEGMARRRRANVSADEIQRLVAYLAKHFGTARPATIDLVDHPEPPEGGLAAVIREYSIPPATLSPGSAVGGTSPGTLVVTDDQTVWFSLRDGNRVGRLDPSLGAFRTWPVPSATSGLEGLSQAPDLGLWFAEASAGKAVRLDPATGQLEDFPAPLGSGAFAHDARGNLYVAVGPSGQITRRDAATGDLKVFDLPDRGGYPTALAVDSRDRVWASLLFADSIVSLEPASGAIREYAIPTRNAAPRGLAIDKEGTVCFTEWLGNKLGRLDAQTGGITEYELPAPSSEPYDVAVDREQKVWIAGHLSNTLIRFDPAGKGFLEYPAPMPRAGLGKLAADPVSGIWFAARRTGSLGLLVPPDKRR